MKIRNILLGKSKLLLAIALSGTVVVAAFSAVVLNMPEQEIKLTEDALVEVESSELGAGTTAEGSSGTKKVTATPTNSNQAESSTSNSDSNNQTDKQNDDSESTTPAADDPVMNSDGPKINFGSAEDQDSGSQSSEGDAGTGSGSGTGAGTGEGADEDPDEPELGDGDYPDIPVF